MPPARTIIVDTRTILANIAAIAGQQRAAVEARVVRDATAFWNPLFPRQSEADRKQKCEAEITEKLAAELPQTVWVPRDLELLAGKQLTASERIRHQQAMRKLEADGLVVLDTRYVRLTDKGRLQSAEMSTKTPLGSSWGPAAQRAEPASAARYS